jgi:SAM-dependent methyltransferase
MAQRKRTFVLKNYRSETEKYRELTTPYCKGCGIDIASGGDPVVPWAWQFDLPVSEFSHYNSGKVLPCIPLRGRADKLPVENFSLDFVYSSHLLEDYLESQWNAVLIEWSRVIKPGGHLVILCPERKLWAAALIKGQTPNCSHKYEPFLGDITRHANAIGGLIVKIEKLTNLFEGDYSILFVAEKT